MCAKLPECSQTLAKSINLCASDRATLTRHIARATPQRCAAAGSRSRTFNATQRHVAANGPFAEQQRSESDQAGQQVLRVRHVVHAPHRFGQRHGAEGGRGTWQAGQQKWHIPRRSTGKCRLDSQPKRSRGSGVTWQSAAGRGSEARVIDPRSPARETGWGLHCSFRNRGRKCIETSRGMFGAFDTGSTRCRIFTF